MRCAKESIPEIFFDKFGQGSYGGRAWAVGKRCVGLAASLAKIFLRLGETFGGSLTSGFA